MGSCADHPPPEQLDTEKHMSWRGRWGLKGSKRWALLAGAALVQSVIVRTWITIKAFPVAFFAGALHTAGLLCAYLVGAVALRCVIEAVRARSLRQGAARVLTRPIDWLWSTFS